KSRYHVSGQLRSNVAGAAGDASNRINEFLSAAGFDQIARSAGAESLFHHGVIRVHAQEDQFDRTDFLEQNAAGIDPVESGHRNVGHDNIWSRMFGNVDHFAAIAGKSGDVEFVAQYFREAFDEHQVVVRQEHIRSTHHFLSRSSLDFN